MFKSIKSLFGGDKEAAPLPSLLGAKIGRTLTIEDLAYKILGDDRLFNLENPMLVITAQSATRLEDGTWLHRFYTDDEMMLQVLGGDGLEDDSVDDVALMIPYDSFAVSQGGSDDRRLIKSLGELTHRIEDADYHNHYAGDAEIAEPVIFSETVWLDSERAETSVIHQHMALFVRTLAGDFEELLQISREESDDGVYYSKMLGLQLSPGDISL